jgi:hypothetical protein
MRLDDIASCDRIQLPMHFDADRMREDVAALNLRDFVYYDVMPLTAPAHLLDPTVAPPPAANYADGSWAQWRGTSALDSSAYLSEVVDSFRQHTSVTLVRLLRLAPDSIVEEHTDPTLGLQIEESLIRLTIPIVTNETVTFYLNKIPVPMLGGECWYLRLTDPHSIVNAGQNERINMTIDVIPNEWVRSLLSSSAESATIA